MFTFTITDEQEKKIEEWLETLKPLMNTYSGPIGGRLSYRFTPTSLGIAVYVKDCMSDQELNLTDYDSW
jgi:hypothetical protein